MLKHVFLKVFIVFVHDFFFLSVLCKYFPVHFPKGKKKGAEGAGPI